MTAMTNSQVIGMAGVLLAYAMVGLGLIVGAALALNHLAYWIEDRHARRRAQLDVASRCNVYTLRPHTERHRGDAA